MKKKKQNRYLNGNIYTTFSYTDECYSGDEGARWDGGDSYWKRYYCRVPRKLLAKCQAEGDMQPVYNWIEENAEKGLPDKNMTIWI